MSEPGTLRAAIARFLGRLEEIRAVHDEVTDTDVREELHAILECYFVWGREPVELPPQVAMNSPEGDRLVLEAARELIEAARASAEWRALAPGQARLDALQDESIVTPGGERCWLFLGIADRPGPSAPLPPSVFEPRRYFYHGAVARPVAAPSTPLHGPLREAVLAGELARVHDVLVRLRDDGMTRGEAHALLSNLRAEAPDEATEDRVLEALDLVSAGAAAS